MLVGKIINNDIINDRRDRGVSFKLELVCSFIIDIVACPLGPGVDSDTPLAFENETTTSLNM